MAKSNLLYYLGTNSSSHLGDPAAKFRIPGLSNLLDKIRNNEAPPEDELPDDVLDAFNQDVVSTNLERVTYNMDEELLQVRFRSGGIYNYYGVPLAEYDELMTAPSAGKYFYHNIRMDYDYDMIR